VSYIAEPTLRELLWYWLPDEYEISQEVRLSGQAKIDLVAKTPGGEYIGYEVKDHNKLLTKTNNWVDANSIRSLFQQLNKYKNSGYLDRLYFCSQEPLPILEKLDSTENFLDMSSINQVGEIRQEHVISKPQEVGAIEVPLDFTRNDGLDIIREAGNLARNDEPELSREDEEWVQHHVWEEFYGAIREGVIPNTRGNTESRIDVIYFEGTTDPTQVYENQEENDIVGIEAKGSGFRNIEQQLKDYLNSGALTELYLAVPNKSRQRAVNLLSEQATLDSFSEDSGEQTTTERTLSDVGLITVGQKGDVKIVRQASRLELRVDGMNTRDTGDGCKSVGWGRIDYRDCEEFASVFDQEDEIHRKARELNVNWQNRTLVEAKYKVQSGGEPTEEERRLIEREYERQYGNNN
jgi:hypothetical protein